MPDAGSVPGRLLFEKSIPLLAEDEVAHEDAIDRAALRDRALVVGPRRELCEVDVRVERADVLAGERLRLQPVPPPGGSVRTLKSGPWKGSDPGTRR